MGIKIEEVDPWKALQFACEHLEDGFDKDAFIKDVLHSDLSALAKDWPDFIVFQKQALCPKVFVL